MSPIYLSLVLILPRAGEGRGHVYATAEVSGVSTSTTPWGGAVRHAALHGGRSH